MLNSPDASYELAFMIKSEKDSEKKIYEIYTLPYFSKKGDKYGTRNHYSESKMKLSLDGVTLELPFTKGILENEFVSYIARLVIGNNKIVFDVDDFDENMFPERDGCHC